MTLDERVVADEGRSGIFAHSQFGGAKRVCNKVGNRRCGQTMSAVKIFFVQLRVYVCAESWTQMLRILLGRYALSNQIHL